MPSIEQVQLLLNVLHHACWLFARSLYAADSVLVRVPLVAQPVIAHATSTPINAPLVFMPHPFFVIGMKPDDPGSDSPVLCDEFGGSLAYA
jgi:hypothetical protein